MEVPARAERRAQVEAAAGREGLRRPEAWQAAAGRIRAATREPCKEAPIKAALEPGRAERIRAEQAELRRAARTRRAEPLGRVAAAGEAAPARQVAEMEAPQATRRAPGAVATEDGRTAAQEAAADAGTWAVRVAARAV